MISDARHLLLEYFSEAVLGILPQDDLPVRFVITNTDDQGYHCELGVLKTQEYSLGLSRSSIFAFKKRQLQNNEQFNTVLIVPTGIGAEIGGHSGDAGPVARLLASACDNLWVFIMYNMYENVRKNVTIAQYIF